MYVGTRVLVSCDRINNCILTCTRIRIAAEYLRLACVLYVARSVTYLKSQWHISIGNIRSPLFQLRIVTDLIQTNVAFGSYNAPIVRNEIDYTAPGSSVDQRQIVEFEDRTVGEAIYRLILTLSAVIKYPASTIHIFFSCKLSIEGVVAFSDLYAFPRLIEIIIAAVVVPNFNSSAVITDPSIQLTLIGRIDLPVYLVSMTFLYH